MRAPGQREDRAGMRQRLEGDATLGIPDPDGPIIATAGKRASIGSKGKTGGGLGMPTRPERGTTFDLPQLDAAIQAPAGQQAFVWTEGEGQPQVRVRLPGHMYHLASLAPHPHPPPPPPL